MDSNLVIGLIGLAVCLTWLAWKGKQILVAISASLLWFGLAMWLFFATVPVLGFAENYQWIFGGVFFMLTFVPLLSLMDTEITHRREDQSWTEHGARPGRRESNYDKYKVELLKRTRR